MTSIIASLRHIMWHPASIEDPPYIRDPASIKTTDLDPQLLFETRLLLEVLRYKNNAASSTGLVS